MDQCNQKIDAARLGCSERRSFHTLDALRGVAAFAILFGHAPHHTIELQSSFLAVDLFFVLSGFVLSHAYEDRLIGGLRPVTFMRLRWIRLVPLHLLGLLLGAIFILCFQPAYSLSAIFAMIFAGLFFLPFPAHVPNEPDFLFALNIPAWSLFMEMAINLVYSSIVVRLGTRPLIFMIAFGAFAVAVAGASSGTLNGGWAFSNIAAGFARVLFSFFAGVGVYRLWRAKAVPWLVLKPSIAIVALVGRSPCPRANFT